MSLLDLEYDDPNSLVDDIKEMMPIMDAVIEDVGLTNDAAMQSLRAGVSPHIALGLSADHLDAIFASGLNYMRSGEVVMAQTVFVKLVTLKEFDHRFWYALGATLQIQGQLAEATRAYLMSLSLRATDVDGYLRLGECLLAAGEFENALGSFETAVALCDDGHGQDDQKNVAERLAAHVRERMQADSASASDTPMERN
ncbi:MAG: hypothetical protein AAF801_05040 [Pseudomonadota bacterium]